MSKKSHKSLLIPLSITSIASLILLVTSIIFLTLLTNANAEIVELKADLEQARTDKNANDGTVNLKDMLDGVKTEEDLLVAQEKLFLEVCNVAYNYDLTGKCQCALDRLKGNDYFLRYRYGEISSPVDHILEATEACGIETIELDHTPNNFMLQ
ncbi:hypothetical protein FWG95_04235 [Candidatus Saccharibacteria bacterium]|nr:hypothetical protein [Candidatus Saccharibacteria bacterium]